MPPNNDWCADCAPSFAAWSKLLLRSDLGNKSFGQQEVSYGKTVPRRFRFKQLNQSDTLRDSPERSRFLKRPGKQRIQDVPKSPIVDDLPSVIAIGQKDEA